MTYSIIYLIMYVERISLYVVYLVGIKLMYKCLEYIFIETDFPFYKFDITR